MKTTVQSKYLWQRSEVDEFRSDCFIYLGEHQFMLRRQLPDEKWWAWCIANPHNPETYSPWHASLMARTNLEDAIKSFEIWLDDNYPHNLG